ncbi:glutaredoxin-C9-like [Fagus crenata]|jgi:glutaredoxin 3|uniref:Glutaredoxin domain-containing protein n=1 Tax=Fagus sylvatica TaxID=28930 RepID=A0A2N9GT16_FAGSY
MQVAKKSGIRLESSISINPETEMKKLNNSPYETVRHLAACNAVVVFSMSGCCMCTVAKRLLFGLGVGPTVIELDEHSAGHDIQAVLYDLCSDGQQPMPAIFIGGKFLGGIETLMAFHINGSLVPLLKDAGALWL